jgi:2-desacetyl-2-hydroxyethyl bacteriochlorophyllide A dehydrogenase
MEKRIVFTGKQQAALMEYEPPALTGKTVRVRTLYSLMSTGTENIVFNRLFEPGSHWDQWVKYPMNAGYATVGEVEAVGAEVTTLKKDDKVVSRWGHGSCFTIPEDSCFLVPSNMDLKDAPWFAMAKIAFMGVKAAHYRLGDSVMVVGAGPIGQMAVRWAYALGLQSITAIDPVKLRLEFARQGGAHVLIDAPVTDDLQVPESRVVVDCTGNAKVFASALHLVKTGGTVVILGDTGMPTTQHLTSDVIKRGLTIIGAHDGNNDEEWNPQTIIPYFFKLVESGRFPITGLNTHEFSYEQFADAYRLANEAREKTMGILFDWTKES